LPWGGWYSQPPPKLAPASLPANTCTPAPISALDQRAVGGDATPGVLVDDRQDQAAALVACENGRARLAQVILRDRIVAGR
jgi:hypothetical protein